MWWMFTVTFRMALNIHEIIKRNSYNSYECLRSLANDTFRPHMITYVRIKLVAHYQS